MFFKLAKFEFNYFRKQPSFYVTMLLFFLMPFFAMISDNVQIGGATNVNFNSPQAITQTMLIMSLAIGMFVVANFVGGTAVRDTSFKMDGIMLSMPIDNASYLWGRLFGAYGFCLLIFMMAPLGTFIGSFWPTVDTERLGDTTLLPYLWTYIVFIIPNFLFFSALFYIFALKTRSMMGMYLGVVGFFILYSVSRQLLNNPDYVDFSALLDPLGLGAFGQLTRYWTPFERNTQLVPLEGVLLANRLIWIGVSLGMIILTHLFFDTRKPVKINSDKFKQKDQLKPPTTFSLSKPDAGFMVDWKRFWTRTTFEILQIIKSAPFIILCVFSCFMLITLFFDNNGMFGTSNWPLTRNMAEFIAGSFSLMVIIVLTYYSAEIVWRERSLGIGDIIESTPTRNWTIYFPKLLAMVTVIVSLCLVGIAFTVFYQTTKSYATFEWDVYFGILTLTFVIPMMMNTILAIFIQVLSPNKYIGMMILAAYFVVSIVLSQLGLEHNMWHFASTPSAVYSDINQYGHFMESTNWYNLYWSGFTLMLVVFGFGLWRRGAEYELNHRFATLHNNIGKLGFATILVGLFTFVGSGSYIYYNTRVLNQFVSQDDTLDLSEEFEKQYKQYNEMDVPSITDVYAEVDFYPEERGLKTKGYYLLTNRNEQPLEKVMMTWDSGKNREFSFSIEGANEVERDDKFGVTWIKFEPPLAKGAEARLDFNFERSNKGFVDRGSDTSVVANGSFVNNMAIFPHFGYNSGFEINDRHERRKRELEPKDRLPKLEDESQYRTNFLGKEADFINFETIVSTVEGQFAISPGYLQKEWKKDGRHYYHYKMDAPIFNFVAFLSGTYDLEEDTHNDGFQDVKIEVYHHPDHNRNVKRMTNAVKASLDYFGQEFSPYQHRQVRIIEFPRYARFAQSFSNTIPYSEDIGFIADLRDKDATDYVFFVTAHEMAHQWWGHQLTPANVQGSAVLSETLSEYSAYMVMEKHLGKDQMRQFLKWEMDRYLRGRSTEVVEEMPLYRAENQQYIHYQKGGVVMYALRDRIGEEAVNTALRNLLNKFQYSADPYPTTLDLLEFIKAESSESDYAFIDDLFTKITVFDLKTKSAVAKKLDNGNYELTLTIEAAKYYADGQGEETETDLDNSFDIGIFSKNPDETKGSDHVQYFKKHEIKQGENTVVVEVSELPEYAGVDPYIKMIDRNSNDNLKKVVIE